MNHRNQDQLTQAKPAQATSKAGPSKALQLRDARAACVSGTIDYLVCADDKSAVVQFERGGRFHALGFAGSSCKPAFNYCFKDVEARGDYVSEWMVAQDSKHARKLAEKAARKANPHTLTVGAILYSSWGYEQTNIDFYQVVAVRGAAVDLRKITKDRKHHADDYGTCVANPGDFCGEVIKGKRPDHYNSVRLSSFERATPWDGRPLNWSSYY